MPYVLASPRSGLPVWLIVAICVPVVLVVLGILAAVAIPVFLDQRAKATVESTTVALPETVAGLDRSNDAELNAQVTSMLAELPQELRGAEGAAYTDGDEHTTFVVVATFPEAATSRDIDDVIAGFSNGLANELPPDVGLSDPEERSPGPLGGRISCATLQGDAGGQLCAAVDAATMLVIVDLAPSASLDPDLPRLLREAVVTRGSGG